MDNDQYVKDFEELIKLEAQLYFWSFCRHMDPSFFTPGKWHLKIIAAALQKVEDGEIPKLAISTPPRAGKSYIISLFCAWLIGRHPTDSIMRNSYAADLAEKFSYDIRQMIQSDKFLEIFPAIKLKQDKKSVSDWAITKAKQSTYFCAGVGGPVTGKGCNLVAILDDPIKNIEEALSVSVLDSKWNWYTSTHLSRLETGCPEIQIATRWSKRDIIGRLLEEYPEDWTVITIPALNAQGETFCSEIKTTKEYLDQKRITEDFIWDAEFMQNPLEVKGLLYPIDQLNKFTMADLRTKKPDGIVGFTDTADRGDDYLCSVIGSKYGDYTYITDVVFTQDGVEITEPLVAQQIIDTKCDVMTIEANNGGSSYARNIRKLTKPQWKCSIIDEHESTNKETRILMNAGYVKEYFYFSSDYESGSDYDKFMRALISYVKIGKNKHDDAPDGVTGLAIRMKTKTFNKPKPKPRDDFWDREPRKSAIGGTVTESFFKGGYNP
jgi:predicted phage terminase large subunit-like protein